MIENSRCEVFLYHGVAVERFVRVLLSIELGLMKRCMFVDMGLSSREDGLVHEWEESGDEFNEVFSCFLI